MQDLMEIVKGRSILRVPSEYEQLVLIPLGYIRRNFQNAQAPGS